MVDEVLAVGDVDFQKRCLGKMEEVSQGGRTILFVSHNLESIGSLTKKCLYLEKGMKSFFGPTPEALACYRGHGKENKLHFINERPKPGTHISEIKVIPTMQAGSQSHGKKLELEVTIKPNVPKPLQRCGYE